MSGTFPTGNVRAVNFKDNAPNLVTTSLSGRRQTKSQGQQYFSFTIQTPPLTSTDLKPILGFISKQRGQFESFHESALGGNLTLGRNWRSAGKNGSDLEADFVRSCS